MPKKQKRDWKSYNDQLVKRGDLLIDLDFVENWEKELEEMNRGKRLAEKHQVCEIHYLISGNCFPVIRNILNAGL